MANHHQASKIANYLHFALGLVIFIFVIIVKALQWFQQRQLRNETEEAVVVARQLNFNSIDDEKIEIYVV